MVLEFYRQHNVAPLFVVDARTIDNTRELIAAAGFSYLEFTPRGDYPEAGMLEFGANQAAVDWVLRLDDDELPSASLLAWAGSVGAKSQNQCWFISRRELFASEGKIFYSRSRGKYPIVTAPDRLHPMARFFDRRSVRYREEVHTTGLEELKLYNFAPNENFIVHLNCLVHGVATRLDKIKYYESVKPGSSWQLADEYLPELFSLEFHNASDDGLDEFSTFFLKLGVANGVEALAETDRARALSEVKERAHTLLSQSNGTRDIISASRFDADDVAWITRVPKPVRASLVKLLCTFLPQRWQGYGVAMWDYMDVLQFRASHRR